MRCRSCGTRSRARSGSSGWRARTRRCPCPTWAGSARCSAASPCSSSSATPIRTETTELADVVLPAALWGERTGTFTNADRTVHLSDQAVDPPGEARSDLDIWVDYARRMGFRDRSGRPIPRWSDARGGVRGVEGVFGRATVRLHRTHVRDAARAWRVQWPCTAEATDGTEHLYPDGVFNTDADECETFGHDLATGASITKEQHAAQHLDGRAWLRAAEWEPPPEEPSDEYPFRAAHRPHRLPLPHSYQDRSGPAAAGGRARTVGRAPSGGRRRIRHRGGTAGTCRVAARIHHRPSAVGR